MYVNQKVRECAGSLAHFPLVYFTYFMLDHAAHRLSGCQGYQQRKASQEEFCSAEFLLFKWKILNNALSFLGLELLLLFDALRSQRSGIVTFFFFLKWCYV